MDEFRIPKQENAKLTEFIPSWRFANGMFALVLSFGLLLTALRSRKARSWRYGTGQYVSSVSGDLEINWTRLWVIHGSCCLWIGNFFFSVNMFKIFKLGFPRLASEPYSRLWCAPYGSNLDSGFLHTCWKRSKRNSTTPCQPKSMVTWCIRELDCH